MILPQVDHPSLDQLKAFGLGHLSDADAVSVHAHLEACETCRQQVQDLPDDTMASLLRQAATPPDITHAVTRGPAASAGPVTQAERASSQESSEVPAALADHSRYRILELLGQGGMGAVYKAEHRRMQRTVALKVINPQLVSSKSAVERFQREVQAAARLHHPNIVTAHDADQAGDAHFLVMEYVQGTDLHKELEKRGPLPVAEACAYVRQAALGLQHAWENGMVHRDIKPQNLMLTAAETPTRRASEEAGEPSLARRVGVGTIKILDFGLASLVSETPVAPAGQGSMTGEATGRELTHAGALMGTPDYMAPEQAKDAHKADIRADIYSLGCTFYCLLTGEVPFPGGTAIDKVIAHAERRPQPVNERRKGLPPNLVKVLDRMLAKDPAQRYQTPNEVAAALAPFSVETTPRRSRPRLLVATLLAAAAIILLGGIIWITTDNGQLKIDCKVDDVQVSVSKGGKEYEVIDLKSGTTVRRLPSGDYQITPKGERTDVKVDRRGFTITRWGQVVVTVTAEREAVAALLLRQFAGTDPTITRDGVTPEDGRWRIDANDPRTVRLFEVPKPGVEDGIITYRARMKSEKVEGKAYLEMWCRVPGLGEFFSKGLQSPVQGTSDWASYEIPFFLKKGEMPDLLKLNVVFEGKGTLWIKDVEVHFTGVAQPVPLPKKILGPENPGEIRRFEGHTALVRGVAINADGSRILSCGHDGTVRLWDTAAGKELLKLDAGAGLCVGVAITPDGMYALAGYADGVARLWDLKDGKVVRRFEGHDGEVGAVAVSPDGTRAFTAGTDDHTVRVWNFETGKELHCLKGHKEILAQLAVSPDGRRLLSGGFFLDFLAETTLRLWDVVDGKELGQFGTPGNCGFALLDGGRRALSANRDKKGDALQLWDLSTFKPAGEYRFSGHGFMCLAGFRDGLRAVSGGMDKSVRIWYTESLTELHVLQGHTSTVRAVAVSANGRYVVSAGGDPDPKTSDNSVRLWRVPELSGWVPLFNGKDLTGWKAHPNWRVENGILVGSGPANQAKRSALHSERTDFGDFHLRVDARVLAEDADSGVFVRFGSRQGSPSFCEANIGFGKDVAGHTGSLFGRKLGTNVGEPWIKAPPGLAKPNEWFTLEIIARGQHIMSKVNGTIAADTRYAGVVDRGQIMLQQYGEQTVVQFRKIEIKELPPEDVKAHFSGAAQPMPPPKKLPEPEKISQIREMRRFEGHTDPIQWADISPNGRQVLSCGNDKTLRLWDVESGKEVGRFGGEHTAVVFGVAFSPNGRQALSCGYDGTVRLWDVETAKELKVLNANAGWVHRVAFAPDGRSALATYYNKVAILWDLTTGKEVRRFQGDDLPVSGVAFSPDSTRAVTGGFSPVVKLWEVGTGKLLKRFAGHSEAADSVAFSPKDGRILTGSNDGTARLWDVESGKELRCLEHTNRVIAVAFAPDGGLALTGCLDGNARLWDLDTGKQLAILEGHTAGVCRVLFTPDGRHALTGSYDKTLRLWRLPETEAQTLGEVRRFMGHNGKVIRVALSPNGQLVASSGEDNTVRVWDAKTGQQRHEFKTRFQPVPVALSPDGTLVATIVCPGPFPDKAIVWQLSDGKKLFEIPTIGGWIGSITFSPDSRWVAYAEPFGHNTSDNAVRIHDSRTGKEVRTIRDTKKKINSWTLAFSPDGKELACDGADGVLNVWDPATGKHIRELKGHSQQVTRVEYSGDGQHILTGSLDSSVKVWNAKTGELVRTLDGHGTGVFSGFSRDGRWLVSKAPDHSLEVWDAGTNQKIADLKGHLMGLSHVVISADGRLMASASFDNTVRLWRMPDLPNEPGWVQLFNGKDLTGWRAVGGTPATWKVDNGILRGAGSTSYLVSERSYGDFHLRAEVRINPGASWGLLFRADPAGLGPKKSPRGFGAELTYKGQTNDVEGHMRMGVTLTRDGKPLAVNIQNVKPHDWFPIELIAQGDRVDIKISGGGLGGSKLDPPLAPGPIILHLADVNSALEVRKLEIKELADRPAEKVSEAAAKKELAIRRSIDP